MSEELFDIPQSASVPANANSQPPALALDSLYRIAVEKDFDADKMQKVIDIVNAERARQSSEAFELNFAKMQRELPAIIKDKSAKDRNGKETYRYASLESVLKQVQHIVWAHGFSYSWRNETVADGATRVICSISGYGHTREAYFDIPILEASAWTNAIQQMGSATSYGKRYSLCSALGITIQDEDDDGSSFDLAEIMASAEPLAKIKAAQSLDELAKLWQSIYNEYRTDEALIKLLIAAKDEKKKALAK